MILVTQLQLSFNNKIYLFIHEFKNRYVRTILFHLNSEPNGKLQVSVAMTGIP